MSNLCFNRSLTVEIETDFFVSAGAYKNLITIRDLRIDFSITLNKEHEPNFANLTIFNLSEDSRNAIQNNYKSIKITGGYNGFTDTQYDAALGFVIGDQLFYGSITKVKNKRIAGGWATEIEALDGYADLAKLAYVKTWPGGTPVQTILIDICAAIGTPFDPGCTPLTSVLTKATSYSGPIVYTLNKMSRAFGFDWTMTHGVLELSDPDMPILSAATQFVTLSPDTGLIGSPEIMIDDDPQTDKPIGSIVVTSLLNGKIIPKRPLMILPTNPMTFAGFNLAKSGKKTGYNVSAKGIYIVESVRHFGSNRQGVFHSEATCPIWA